MRESSLSVSGFLSEEKAFMFKEEGYRMMGAAFEVYNQLGYGMAEEIY
jgi:hypothetical protein